MLLLEVCASDLLALAAPAPPSPSARWNPFLTVVTLLARWLAKKKPVVVRQPVEVWEPVALMPFIGNVVEYLLGLSAELRVLVDAPGDPAAWKASGMRTVSLRLQRDQALLERIHQRLKSTGGVSFIASSGNQRVSLRISLTFTEDAGPLFDVRAKLRRLGFNWSIRVEQAADLSLEPVSPMPAANKAAENENFRRQSDAVRLAIDALRRGEKFGLVEALAADWRSNWRSSPLVRGMQGDFTDVLRRQPVRTPPARVRGIGVYDDRSNERERLIGFIKTEIEREPVVRIEHFDGRIELHFERPWEDAALAAFLRGVEAPDNVRTILLEDSGVGPLTVSALSRFQRLQVVSVAGEWITDDTLEPLLELSELIRVIMDEPRISLELLYRFNANRQRLTANGRRCDAGGVRVYTGTSKAAWVHPACDPFAFAGGMYYASQKAQNDLGGPCRVAQALIDAAYLLNHSERLIVLPSFAICTPGVDWKKKWGETTLPWIRQKEAEALQRMEQSLPALEDINTVETDPRPHEGLARFIKRLMREDHVVFSRLFRCLITAAQGTCLPLTGTDAARLAHVVRAANFNPFGSDGNLLPSAIAMIQIAWALVENILLGWFWEEVRVHHVRSVRGRPSVPWIEEMFAAANISRVADPDANPELASLASMTIQGDVIGTDATDVSPDDEPMVVVRLRFRDYLALQRLLGLVPMRVRKHVRAALDKYSRYPDN